MKNVEKDQQILMTVKKDGEDIVIEGNASLQEMPCVIEALSQYIEDLELYIEQEAVKIQDPKRALLNKLKNAFDQVDTNEISMDEILELKKSLMKSYDKILKKRSK
jgi:hypothetical protein